MSEKLMLSCPNCHIEFDLLSIGNQDTLSIVEFKKHLEKDVRSKIEKELITTLEEKHNSILREQKLNFEAEKTRELSEKDKLINKLEVEAKNFEDLSAQKLKTLENELLIKFQSEKQNEINALNKIINQLESDAKSLNEINETKIKNAILEENNKFEIAKKNLENQISDLTNNLKNSDNEKQLALNAIEKELKEKYISELSQKEKEINELRVSNATNRILNNKIKGENWENEVEQELRKLASATGDEIHKITRTGTKADFLQVVKEKETDLGKIVFECKNGEWKDAWEPKLTDDMAKEGANYAILVATSTLEKFKVPFLVSQRNKNILIADPESFVFVSSIVRKFILIESNLRDKSDNSETFEEFNNWKLNSLETFKGVIQKSVEGIEADERTIINKVDDIKKHREKLWRNWQTMILDFLEGFKF